jgi:alpha-L-fucosidase
MFTRREMLRQGALLTGASAVNARMLFAQTGAPDVSAFQPTWESLRDLYRPPEWLTQNRLGIFIHWGLYAIPAHINEWYAKHMYTSDVAWHTAHYGPPDKFGYKDFIPLFKPDKFNPAEWARLFDEAGAGFVIPVAEHHDGFMMGHSDLTPWCAAKMGPKRDLIGELATAVRAQGLIFGLSSHRMEHHTFMYPAAGVPNDQFDPRYAQFYGPPQPGEMNDGLATAAFQQDWLARCRELVERYQPQLVYFDNGINDRAYDAVKLEFAAFLYNHAEAWGKQATIVSKDRAYLAGSVSTFEKGQRAPKWIYPGPWLVDDSISGDSWGYVNGMRYRGAADLLTELVELTCKGGGLLLNVSPMADGSIPEEQQEILRTIGGWMKANSAALNGSRPWSVYGEGPEMPAAPPADWRGGSSANQKDYLPPRRLPKPTEADFRFTVKDDTLYAIGLQQPASRQAKILSLRSGQCRVDRVTHVATGTQLAFQQTAEALLVQLPAASEDLPYVLAVQGSRSLSA